jgi:hypothetical protein
MRTTGLSGATLDIRLKMEITPQFAFQAIVLESDKTLSSRVSLFHVRQTVWWRWKYMRFKQKKNHNLLNDKQDNCFTFVIHIKALLYSVRNHSKHAWPRFSVFRCMLVNMRQQQAELDVCVSFFSIVVVRAAGDILEIALIFFDTCSSELKRPLRH